MSYQRRLLSQRLTTVEIIYHMPDHPHLLQSFIWQDYDVAPQYPALKKFLRFWEAHLDGALHLVRVASAALVRPAEFRYAKGEFRLN